MFHFLLNDLNKCAFPSVICSIHAQTMNEFDDYGMRTIRNSIGSHLLYEPKYFKCHLRKQYVTCYTLIRGFKCFKNTLYICIYINTKLSQ